QKELQNHFLLLKENKIKKIKTAIRFFISFPIFRLNNEFSYNRREKYWLNSRYEIVLYDTSPKLIEKYTCLKYNRFTQMRLNEFKEDIWADKCHHLQAYILDKFNVTITNKNFQHWNGGVFLFDGQAHEFLKAWFDKTM